MEFYQVDPSFDWKSIVAIISSQLMKYSNIRTQFLKKIIKKDTDQNLKNRRKKIKRKKKNGCTKKNERKRKYPCETHEKNVGGG